MADDKSIFEVMKETLQRTSTYHENHKELYNGNHVAEHPFISVPKELEGKIEINLEWAKVAVEYLSSSFMIDAFSNDTFGFTRLMDNQKGWNVCSSAVAAAINSACSFVAVIPQENSEPLLIPYSGSEATGILDNTGTKLTAGLVAHKTTEFGAIEEYLVFIPGAIIRVDSRGKEIAKVELPIDEVCLVPFIFNSSIDKPFGRSLIGNGAVDALENAQRTLKLTSIINEFNAGQGYMMFLKGIAKDELDDVSVVTELGRLNAFFTEDGEIDLQKLTGNSTTELQALLSVYAKQFASATFSPSYLFGIDPANGSISSSTTARQDAPRQRIIQSARESFGDAVKQIAILSMSLLAGAVSPDFSAIKTLFRNPLSLEVSDLGAFGDSIQKLTSGGQSFIPEEFLKNQIGIPIRDDLLNIDLPNFSNSNKLAESYRKLEITAKNYGLEKRDDG